MSIDKSHSKFASWRKYHLLLSIDRQLVPYTKDCAAFSRLAIWWWEDIYWPKFDTIMYIHGISTLPVYCHASSLSHLGWYVFHVELLRKV